MVAVSGGADSMAVWDLLARERRWDLVIWHLDHGLRSDTALDACAIRTLAHRHPPAQLVIERVDLAAVAGEWGIGIEAAGRRHRYARLAEVALAHRAAVVVTAHHHQDQAETLLMNLIRGSGPDGWKGIAACRPLAVGVNLVRPALAVPQTTLRAHAQAEGLPWHEDSTNADRQFRRNFVRQRVLPELECACPGFTAALLARAQVEGLGIAAEVVAVAALAAVDDQGLDCVRWQAAPLALQRRALAQWCRGLGVEVDRHRLGRLADLCHGAPDRRLRLGPWLFTRRARRVTVHAAETSTIAATATA